MYQIIIQQVITTFTQREQEAYGLAGGIAEEVLSSIRTVVAFGGEKNETKRYVYTTTLETIILVNNSVIMVNFSYLHADEHFCGYEF